MSLIPSTITLNLAFSAETLAAVNTLAAAITSASGGSVTHAPVTTGKNTSKPTGADDKVAEDEPKVVIYWANNKAGTFGVVDTQSAYDALKAEDKDVVKATKAQHEKSQKAAAAAAKAAEKDDDTAAPSRDDLIKAFGAFLPANLDDETKAERKAFVQPLVDRFGVKRASDIPEESRALALNLLARHLAGQDVDPEIDEFEALEEESLV